MIPPVLVRAGALLGAYDVLLCDAWGVVHDGMHAYRDACAALTRFREGGGTVVLLSNAPLPSDALALVLDEKGVPRAAWDAIVSSGDLTRMAWRERGLARIHHVGPARDLPLFDGDAPARVSVEEAEALVVTGLVRDRVETAEDYRLLLARALEKDLELLCANPDLVVEVSGALLPCAGALGALYEAMGGHVHWAGKPFAPAYDGALALAARLTERAVDRSRVLAIGDSVRTDLVGAAGAGIDALFVMGGIHRAELAAGPRRLAALLDGEARTTVAAIPSLIW